MIHKLNSILHTHCCLTHFCPLFKRRSVMTYIYDQDVLVHRPLVQLKPCRGLYRGRDLSAPSPTSIMERYFSLRLQFWKFKHFFTGFSRFFEVKCSQGTWARKTVLTSWVLVSSANNSMGSVVFDFKFHRKFLKEKKSLKFEKKIKKCLCYKIWS